MPELRQGESVAARLGATESCAIMDFGAEPLAALRHPAQDLRRIGREEIIIRRGEIDRAQARRIEPHALDSPRETFRQFAEPCDAVRHVAHENAGRVELFAGLRFALDDFDLNAGFGKPHRAGKTRETCADNRAG